MFAAMTNLLKAFDCISHEFLNRTQTTKVSSSFSELLNLIYCIPQGSIFSSLLFVIYISDLFVVNKEVNVSNYAVDTTRFITGMSFEQIIPQLGSILSDISLWFMNND